MTAFSFVPGRGSPRTEPPQGFFYVNQNNYYILDPRKNRSIRFLYTDGATSCLMLAAVGRNPAGSELFALAHPGDPGTLREFSAVLAEYFRGPVDLFVRGAGPPTAPAARENRAAFLRFCNRLTPDRRGNCYLRHLDAEFGRNIPDGSLGLDISERICTDSSFRLTPAQRDPSGGFQTLFAIFMPLVYPGPSAAPLLRDAGTPLSPELKERLRMAARRYHWKKLSRLPEEEILKLCSTTPEYEPDWFVAAIRESARLI